MCDCGDCKNTGQSCRYFGIDLSKNHDITVIGGMIMDCGDCNGKDCETCIGKGQEVLVAPI